MNRTTLKWLAVGATVALLSAACGSDQAGSEDDETTDPTSDTSTETPDDAGATETEANPADADLGTIRVGVAPDKTFSFLPALYGEELGVWEKRGLQVENLRGMSGSGELAQALAANEIDIATSTGVAGVNPILAGLEARIVGNITPSFSVMVMVTDADSDIESDEDLQGKTVGITSSGSLTDFLARQVIAKNGWAEGDMQIATIGGFSEQIAALESDAIDAFVWSAEAGFQLEESGEGRVFVDFGEIVDNNVNMSLNASTNLIEESPDSLQAYLEGWYETVAYMVENEEETIAYCVETFELSEYVCQNVYDVGLETMSTDGSFEQENLKGLAETVAELNPDVDEPPAIESFYNGNFVPVTVE